jgi:hypothetical protein
MISRKQLEANRRNAKGSTGPRTAAGKARVAANAIKHGMTSVKAVICGERECDYALFRAALMSDFRPRGGLEQLLAENAVLAAWRLRRAIQAEAEMFQSQVRWESERERRRVSLGETFDREFRNGGACDNFGRYQSHLERSFYQALHGLERLQAGRRTENCLAAVAAIVHNAAEQKTLQKNGFVSHNEPKADAA